MPSRGSIREPGVSFPADTKPMARSLLAPTCDPADTAFLVGLPLPVFSSHLLCYVGKGTTQLPYAGKAFLAGDVARDFEAPGTGDDDLDGVAFH
jgi:hypothetical protein